MNQCGGYSAIDLNTRLGSLDAQRWQLEVVRAAASDRYLIGNGLFEVSPNVWIERGFLIEFTLQAPQCNDGIDNDGDGLIDFAGGDPGCRDATRRFEVPRCQDGLDNNAPTGE